MSARYPTDRFAPAAALGALLFDHGAAGAHAASERMVASSYGPRNAWARPSSASLALKIPAGLNMISRMIGQAYGRV
jgi:hypothetical protein